MSAASIAENLDAALLPFRRHYLNKERTEILAAQEAAETTMFLALDLDTDLKQLQVK